MPNRILKESITCESMGLSALAPWPRVLFFHLFSQCDDFGRFTADPVLIRSRCFPREVDNIKIASVAEWLNALAGGSDPCLILYQVDGKPYLQMRVWDQQKRARFSKFPGPEQGEAIIPVKETKAHKEPKPKPPEKVEYAPFVHLTKDEYLKLVDTFTEPGTKERIEKLSLYKRSKGKQNFYKDDYATILSWERRDKEHGTVQRTKPGGDCASVVEQLSGWKANTAPEPR